MKLLSKQREGKKVRYVYDPAKTPLQRLLLSGVLPAQKQQELTEVAHALDPVRLFQQLELLQQAVFRCAVSIPSLFSTTSFEPVRVFSVEYCTMGNVDAERSAPDPAAGLHTLYHGRSEENASWAGDVRRQDPFGGEWEQIMSWLVANPERSSGDIFRELQQRSPGRYQPFQIRTLQRGMRKIRTYLLETFEEQWQAEVIHGRSPQPVSSASNPAKNS